MSESRPIDPSALQSALKAAFPDGEVDAETAAAMSEAAKNGEVMTSVQTSQQSGALSFSENDAALRYYTAHAVHTRTGDVTSIFEGRLPQARVRLPDTGGKEPIETAMGMVIPNDRKIASAAQLKQLVGRPVGRVELVTAPRAPDAKGARFGAIALYLGYDRANDRAPSFYVLEAGTATGQPKVLFYGEKIGQWIKNQRTAYTPTPFSSPKNFYDGVLRMREDNPDEPHTLTVEGRTATEATWHIQVGVTYHIEERPPAYSPMSLIFEAAARVGMVGDALGVKMDTSINVAKTVLGGSLEWIAKPGE